ncbi:DUF4360 domain-containing protein [Actinomadura terrae]|uniref:DUF4360 domain-containing protein n=1 Tax=Actinomadura terrae TaxID=604353 RepID=UPI001FA6F6A9|nr:DUF4360 domain-containing protein [Actinomadura terrae]
MMNAKRTAIALAAPLALAALTAAPASAAPAIPDGVTVEVATVNGSGCPKGTSAVVISEDRTAFTVSYSDYHAYAGGDATPVDSRKNCQLSVNVHVPDGYTYAISGAEHRGFTGLEAGATGLLRTNYYFQGLPRDTTADHQVRGPEVKNWEFNDRIPAPQLDYKPCGVSRNLNLNTELVVDQKGSDGKKTSFMSMDSTHSSARYYFEWKRCP